MFRWGKQVSAVMVVFCLAAGFMAACQAQASAPIVILYSSPTPTVTQTPMPATPTLTPTPSPQPSPTARLGCADQHGATTSLQVMTKGFAKAMDVIVYQPPCYADTYTGGYPVLYLLHGQSFTDDQWGRLGVPAAADADFLSGMLKPFIVVMPRDEYYLEDWYHSSFGENLANGLVPWVDSHYHTCSQRSCRAIGGLSRGATWAVVLGISHWQLFGTVGAHSLPASPYTEATTRDHFLAMQSQYPRLWLDIGDVDSLRPGAEKFKDYLQKYNIPFEWHLYQGGHTEVYWSAHVSEYLQWYGQAWK